MNDLVRNRLKEILQLQDSIKLKKLNYIAKIRERMFSVTFHYLLYFQEIYTQTFYQ